MIRHNIYPSATSISDTIPESGPSPQKVHSVKTNKFSLFNPFKPEKSLVSMYHVIFVILIILFGGILLLAGFFSESGMFLAGSVVLLLVIVGFYFFWIGKYYDTIFFELKDDEVTWKRGVWFRMTGIVPYDRITNIDIYQGPLMRYFGFSSIKLQTAGYSAQARSEIILEGIMEAEELRETIRSLIRKSRTVAGPSDATGTPARQGTPHPSDDSLVGEIRAIRQLLEHQFRK